MNKDSQDYKEAEGFAKINHFTSKGMEIKGIIHVGANDWFEYQFYKRMGIKNLLGFEPIPEACSRFYETYPDEKHKLINLGLHRWQGEVPFNLSKGGGQSSSMYQHRPEYLWSFPDLAHTENKSISVVRFDSWLATREDIKLSDYNCLVVDVEGNELNVLRGFGRHLQHFDMLSVELSETPVYYDSPVGAVISNYLETHGFRRDSEIKGHDDVFFINENYDKNKSS